MISGWLSTALLLSALGTAGLGWAFPTDKDAAFFASAAIVTICILPLLIVWGFKPAKQSPPELDSGSNLHLPSAARQLVLLWFARAMVQISASFVLLYLFLDVAERIADKGDWQNQSATHFVSLLSSLGAGVAVSTAVFQMGLPSYLSVDTALVAHLIGHHRRRGAILGTMNLTNTLPAILVPTLTLQVFTASNYAPPLATFYLSAPWGCSSQHWQFLRPGPANLTNSKPVCDRQT